MNSSNTHVVFFLVGCGLRGCNLDLSQLGQISKTRQKLDFKKIVKLTDRKSLTISECKTNPPKTEIDVNLLKFAWKIS